eukprot:COSAG06_NODE_40848_length_397_cov_53.654362_1_plen_91_part_10
MYRIGALAAPINVPDLALAEAEAERHAGRGEQKDCEIVRPCICTAKVKGACHVPMKLPSSDPSPPPAAGALMPNHSSPMWLAYWRKDGSRL